MNPKYHIHGSTVYIRLVWQRGSPLQMPEVEGGKAIRNIIGRRVCSGRAVPALKAPRSAAATYHYLRRTKVCQRMPPQKNKCSPTDRPIDRPPAPGPSIGSTPARESTPSPVSPSPPIQSEVEFLLREGAEAQAATQRLVRPAHVAAVGGHFEVLGRLVERKAEVDAKDRNGKTPEDYAKARGFGAAFRKWRATTRRQDNIPKEHTASETMKKERKERSATQQEDL